MTVAEIKEYAHTIAEYIKNYREVCREEGVDEERIPTTPLQNDIEHLVSMLDELDRPKANWVATERHLYMCTNCESEFIETSEHNYCPYCGAKMEPYKESKKC